MAGLDPAIHAFLRFVDPNRLAVARMGAWVYIMTNRPNGTLYVGATADLARRAWEHRQGVVGGFTRKYGLNRLVYAEWHDEVVIAKQREMNIKHWRRAWKVQLIHRDNPFWEDLYDRFV